MSQPMTTQKPRHMLPSLARSVSLLALLAGPVTAQSYRPVLTPAPGDTGVTIEVERHPNGQLSKRVYRLAGQPNGLWQEWDSTGRLRLTADWKNGRGEGVWMYFHPNGIVSERSWVTNDVWHGPSEGWHANGQKAFEGMWLRGAKDGPFRYWDDTGTPRGPGALLLHGADRPTPALTEGWPSDFNVWDISVSRDLETLFVGTGGDDGTHRRIMIRRWRQGAWQPVEPAPFADTSAAEGTPVVSPDGEWVYFSSARHATREPGNPHRDLYRASRASGWKTVERVTNTPLYGEITLTLARDGRGVLWTDRRRDGSAKMGLYEVRMSQRAPAKPPRLAVVADLTTLHRGDTSGEANPVIAPDGSFLLFANYDVDGQRTLEDMFISTRTRFGWSLPKRLANGGNSAQNDTPSQLLADGKTLLFISSRTTGARVYSVTLNGVLPKD